MGVLRKGKALWERATQRFPQLKVKGIRQRWLLNSISILVMILLVVVVAFSVVIRNYYDSSILSDMESKARIAANYFGTNASGDTSSEDYLTTAQNYVSSFEDGTRLEPLCSASFAVFDQGARRDYSQFGFDIPPEDLAGCTLRGDFYTASALTEGRWQVTFPLENDS